MIEEENEICAAIWRNISLESYDVPENSERCTMRRVGGGGGGESINENNVQHGVKRISFFSVLI